MSFELQETSTCGLSSLRYALSLHGVGFRNGEELDLDDIRRAMKKKWWKIIAKGTREDELARAARRLGLRTRMHSYGRENPGRFLADLEGATRRGHTAIVGWHEDEDDFFPWVLVAGFTGSGRVIVFDPALMDDDLPAATFRAMDEDCEHAPGLMSRARFREWITPTEGGEESHFFLELWPAPSARGRFVPGMIDERALAEMARDDELITHFDEYIDDLRDIFALPHRAPGGERASRFLERNRRDIISCAARWTLADYCPPSYVARELASLTALTRCYDFRVPHNGDAVVLRDLGFYLGWRCCERSYEVGRYDG